MLQSMIRSDGILLINESNLKIIKKKELLDYIRFLNSVSSKIFLNDDIRDIEKFINRIKPNKKIKIVHLINMYIDKMKSPINFTKNIKGLSNTNLINLSVEKTVNKIV